MGRELRLVNFSSVAQGSYRLFHGVVFHCFGYQLFSEETDIYTTAPDIPVMETKQVVPVHVNHSNLRYVTEKEAEKLSYLRTTVPTVVLTLLLGSVGLLLTHRDANRNRKRKE